MNVKELIASQPPEAIATLLLGKFRNQPDSRDARERAVNRLIKFIKDLDRIKPIESGHLILGIFLVFSRNPSSLRWRASRGWQTRSWSGWPISESSQSPMRLNFLPGMRSSAMRSTRATPA